MTTWRELCRELIDSRGPDTYRALERARKALADRPAVPEGREPAAVIVALEQLTTMASDELDTPGLWAHSKTAWENAIEAARAALAQPEPEAVRPTDEEIEEWAEAVAEVPLEALDPDLGGWQRCFNSKEFCQMVRAVLARWGSPNLAELRRSLGEPAERQAAPVPVAVSERLPGPEDCESHGWCWVLYRGYSTWALEPPCGQDGMPTGWTHWLPAHALPLPSGEVEA